jgi:hypothetical protein
VLGTKRLPRVSPARQAGRPRPAPPGRSVPARRANASDSGSQSVELAERCPTAPCRCRTAAAGFRGPRFEVGAASARPQTDRAHRDATVHSQGNGEGANSARIAIWATVATTRLIQDVNLIDGTLERCSSTTGSARIRLGHLCLEGGSLARLESGAPTPLRAVSSGQTTEGNSSVMNDQTRLGSSRPDLERELLCYPPATMPVFAPDGRGPSSIGTAREGSAQLPGRTVFVRRVVVASCRPTAQPNRDVEGAKN